MIKFSSFLLLSFLLVTFLIDVRLAIDDEDDKTLKASNENDQDQKLKAVPEDEEEDKILKAPETAKTAKPGKRRSKGDPIDAYKDLKDKYNKIKKDKSSKGFEGKSGNILKLIVDILKDINPIGLINELDIEPLLKGSSINSDKFKISVDYLSDAFFDKFSKRTGWSKKDLSKELKVDVVAKKAGTSFSLAQLLKTGQKKKLKLGDYLDFAGIDLKKLQKTYEDFLIESIRVPVQFIDEVFSDGFSKFIKLVVDYVNINGGFLHSAIKLYQEHHPKIKVTSRSVIARHGLAEKMVAHARQLNIYKEKAIFELKAAYKDWFGKGGRAYVYQDRIMKLINNWVKFVFSISSGEVMAQFINLVGFMVGPEARAILYIVYQPTATMFNQVFGPLLLIQKTLSLNEDLWDKLLALPPIIIQNSGGRFKPLLMVTEPFIRLFRFISTSEYTKSLSAGLDISAAFGISIWGGAYKPKKLKAYKQLNGQDHHDDPQGGTEDDFEDNSKIAGKRSPPHKKRGKRETKKKSKNPKSDDSTEPDIKTNAVKRELTPEHAAIYTESDIKMADAYQGGPPPGGYKLGVTNDGKVDLDDEDLISRILLTPDFILKAGGPVFVPFASVLAPCLRVVNTVLFGKEDFTKRISEVPDIIRGVGLVGPLADVVEAALPFIKTGYLVNTGKLTKSDVVVQTPALVKQLTNGVLYNLYKNPEKLLAAMLEFLPGHGGLLAMLRLQATGNVPTPDPGAAENTIQQLSVEGNFIFKILGEFFGGWALTYIQALGPIGSMYGALVVVIGNIFSAVRLMDQNVDLKAQPLKNLIEAFDNLPLMLKSADNKNRFLTAVLGGQDPDVFPQVGINIEKLTDKNIDPAVLLAGGKKFLPNDVQGKLAPGSLKAVGIDISKLSKLGLNENSLLESGLLDADEDKLLKNGIEMTAILNRVMRGSLDDNIRLMQSGISLKTMLKNGIDPALFLAGGVKAIPKTKSAKKFGSDPSDDDLKTLGLNSAKLNSKGINAKKLAKDGIGAFEKSQTLLGLNTKQLFTSVFVGLEPEKLSKAGIDLKVLLANGYDPKMVLTGGLKKALNNDVSDKSLAKAGINLNKIIDMGINIHLLTDVGAAILNPINMIKIGVDPMRVLIGTLSRHGLDSLTGGLEDATNISIEFINSILRIISNTLKLAPIIRQLPGGKNIVGPDGQWIGIPGFIFYKILGINGHGGVLGFLQKLFSWKMTTAEIMALINPIRIVDEIANPKRKPSIQRRKENRKAVDEYIMKSENLRFASKSESESESGPKSSVYKRSGGKGEESDSDGGSTESSGGDEDQSNITKSKSRYPSLHSLV